MHSLSISKISPMLGISYTPHYSVKVFANYQTGFRIPTIRDLYLFPVSNENLSEEEVNSFEVGLEYFVFNRASLKISYYHNDVKNIILLTVNPDGPPPVKFQNSGNAVQNGIEAGMTYRLNEDVNLQLSYSYLDSGELTAFNPTTQFKYLVTYNNGDLDVSLFGKYVKDLFTANNSQGKLPDYHLLNANISYTFADYRLSLRINNLFDKEYFIITDYPAPGRYFVVGFDFSI